ncbi:MAG: hypothetical protein ACRDYZ_02390 [Acidimicrobiales bacterium]
MNDSPVVVHVLCDHCRARELRHAAAALAILGDTTAAYGDERKVARDELVRAARWLRLPAHVPTRHGSGARP